jgi:hypothetical protein
MTVFTIIRGEALHQQRREERKCLCILVVLILISMTFTALTVTLAHRSTGVRFHA